MTDQTETASAPTTQRPIWQSLAKWVAIGVGVIVLLVVVALLALNSGPGKRFIIEQVANYELENGISVDIGEIEGSIYSQMTLKDIKIRDPKGIFLTSPVAKMDWNPSEMFGSKISINELSAQEMRMSRMPVLNPTDPNDPYLPNINLNIAKFEVGRFIMDEAVTGQPHIASFSGRAEIADRRARLFADASTISGPNLAGGDKMKLVLDAVPDDNIFNIDTQISGPTDGLIASLAGFTQPFDLDIQGKGDWKKWDGTVLANLGSESLANIKIAARDGTFAMKGTSAAGLLFEGPTSQLLAPTLNIDATATMAERVADTEFTIFSDALRIAADGKIDLGENKFNNLLVDLQILQPTAIAENLVGNGVTAALKLDGLFAAPVINYQLNAAMLGFGETRLQRLTASGVADFSTERKLIPISAKVARITGLNEAVGGLLTNVSLNGDIAVDGARILSDNIVVRSDRLNANAVILADMDKGLYTGAIDGRVNDFRIESVGIFNLETDVDLEADADGGYALVGTVSARSTQLFNDGVREFLGGNTLITSNVGYGSDGVARISNLRVAAPSFRVTNGRGTYTANGGIDFAASAFSNQYGPLGVSASGTLAQPVAFVTAARPGVGIGLVNVKAAIRGNARGYDVDATGGTDYGPFKADVLIASGRGPLAIDVNSLLFAGIDFAGRVVQTTAGPFRGKLRGSGQGIAGVVTLSNQGKYQRADVTARANGARIPGAYNISIGRAIIDGYAVLYDTPQVIGDAQLANVNYGEMSINAARAKIDYQGGRGTAKILAEGYSTVPFRVAANAKFEPKLWLVAMDGRANSINFKTASPARIIPVRGGYKMLPSKINLDKGSLRLAGTYANTLKLQSRLDNLDLSLINTVYPGYGLGGSATGSIDFEQPNSATFPRADARLNIKRLTRTSLAAISTPVDVSFVGRLLPNGGDSRALIRKNGTVIGRMQASLTPLPPGRGSWVTRLMAAPLSGGIRYNGPADTLFSLAALPEQKLTGDLGVAADFSGRVQSPQLTGVVRANNLTYENETFGTRLTSMKVNGKFANDRLELTSMTAKAGEGTVDATGFIGLASDAGYPINLQVKMDNARLAKSDDLGATATGNIAIINNRSVGPLIKGDIALPETRYKVIYQGGSEVAQLSGVRWKPPRGRKKVTGDRVADAATPSIWKLDVGIKADNRIFISGMGLESEWETDLRITGTTSDPRVAGTVRAIRGTYSFSGRRFTLDKGIIRFAGGAVTNPSVDLSAEADIDGVTTILNVTGRAQKPQIAFTSNPALPQDEVISRILFGSSVQNLSAIQAVQLASSLNSLRGGGGGLNPLGKLQSAAGFDRLRILGADKDTGRGTALAVGKYLTDDVYLEVITDSKGFTATQLEIALTKSLSILSQAGSFGETNVNVRYSKDY